MFFGQHLAQTLVFTEVSPCNKMWFRDPKRTNIRRPRLQQGERVRGGITSSKGQEVITSSKGKKQENKKEETRSKKQLQATSGKKQETRSQKATSGWKTGQRASFLVDSESNVRQAAAPFVMRLLAAGRQLRQLVFL